MKYSPLDQINKSNVRQLELAWEYDTGDSSDGTKYPYSSAFEATPLVIDGVMYLTTPFHRLLALDAETGKLLWAFDPHYDRMQARQPLCQSRRRLLVRTAAKAASPRHAGRPALFDRCQDRQSSIPAFGDNGVLDIGKEMIEKFPELRYGLTSPVAVCGDVLVAGGWVSDGEPQGPSGDIRGFDVRTGKQLWRFHTVPRPGEFGHDTWEGDSWKDRGGSNAWSVMSVDEKRGMVFAPLTSASIDFYGGDRKGDNLFSDSVVALDCKTGERKWHFQTIHHDLWDWDLPSHPSLVTVKRDGKDVPAVAKSPRPASCSCWIAGPASRCSMSKRGPCRRATSPASSPGRPSHIP